ncbi:hypothetical protein AB835_06695 [Candidatus Endobugula sertula]|uniref:AMP-dependent synthetase/ligase domain-containing protein n=1 Tax=Candidatus Endobugula sertula TaxID=62101 RepID=A0A1D2QQG7_9GAMM|nr:hypothetical protein AB835_06695 [Candidatus Endobugula sertula]
MSNTLIETIFDHAYNQNHKIALYDQSGGMSYGELKYCVNDLSAELIHIKSAIANGVGIVHSRSKNVAISVLTALHIGTAYTFISAEIELEGIL